MEHGQAHVSPDRRRGVGCKAGHLHVGRNPSSMTIVCDSWFSRTPAGKVRNRTLKRWRARGDSNSRPSGCVVESREILNALFGVAYPENHTIFSPSVGLLGLPNSHRKGAWESRRKTIMLIVTSKPRQRFDGALVPLNEFSGSPMVCCLSSLLLSRRFQRSRTREENTGGSLLTKDSADRIIVTIGLPETMAFALSPKRTLGSILNKYIC
jgi:hypothetical protein